MKKLLPVCFAALAAFAASAAEIGFEEEFALSADRAATLSKLVPGSDEHYFYSCLVLQQQGRLDEARDLLAPWQKAHKETPRFREMRLRQALLDYDGDPEGTRDFLVREQGLSFHHARRQAAPRNAHPARLDPALVAGDAWARDLAGRDEVHGYADSALETLLAGELSDAKRRNVLSRLARRPDVPDFAQIVLADLQAPHSGGFGSLGVHSLLFLDDLRFLAGQSPALLANDAFVGAMAARLSPAADSEGGWDPGIRRAELAPLLEFALSLPPAQNPFKAKVLFHALECDLALDVHDPALFDAYLRLPRDVPYVRPQWRDALAAAGAWNPVRPDADDTPLVRAYLSHFLADAPDASAFAETLEEGFLNRVLAETKLLQGDPDADRWYALLPAGSHAALRDRVDIEFLPTCPEVFGVDDPVAFDVAVKNVARLTVQVFELNPFQLYRENEDLTTAIDLDGLSPTFERTIHYDVPPLRRHVERIDVPEIRGRGAYVVELIGDTGVSSRALVRKGRLYAETRNGSAGTVFTVSDETGAAVPDARVWFAGHEYAADEDGSVTVPYRAPSDRPVSVDPFAGRAILRHGDFSEPVPFFSPEERYDLDATFTFDRESFVAGSQALVLFHPRLACAGERADIALLRQPVLEITATDAEGVATQSRLTDLALSNTDATEIEFSVPEGTRSIGFRFTAKVRNLSLGKDEDLEVVDGVALNGQDATPQAAAAYLRRTDSGYRIEARGKNGEPLAGVIVRLEFYHRDYTQPRHALLQTGDDGALDLGALPGIASVAVVQPAEWHRSWALADGAVRLPGSLVVREGETLEIPLAALPAADVPLSAVAGLHRLAGGMRFAGPSASVVPLSDASASLRLADGALEIAGLEPGDYRLDLKPPYGHGAFPIRVVGGAGPSLLSDPAPPRIASLECADGHVRVRVANANADTRVQLLARWSCSDGLPAAWGEPDSPALPGARLPPRTLTVSGRRLGDEVRYVLERRFAGSRIGNLLARPSLLLAPWDVRTTRSSRQTAREGEDYHAVLADEQMVFGAPRRESAMHAGGMALDAPADGGAQSTFDFLPGPALIAPNLVPDADGNVAVALADLGFRGQIVAILSDGSAWSAREIGLPETSLEPRDRALRNPLPDKPVVAEHKRVSPVAPGARLVIDDIRSTRLATVETVGEALRLFRALAPDEALDDFAFLADWPSLAPERQEELYSRFACHELNLFLHAKDRAFFDRVVRPFLENKRDKQFLDEYLLGRDLSPWLETGRYDTLNALERALIARRLPGSREGVVRQLADAAELARLEDEVFDRRFRTALQGGALDGEAPPAPGFAGAAKEEAEDRSAERALARGGVEKGAARARLAAPQAAAPAAVDALARRKDGANAFRLESDKAKREAAVFRYHAPALTKEWAESHYYRVPLADASPSLVPCNGFWRDFAAADEGVPFLSSALLEACSSRSEILCALAVLGLPFDADGAKRELDGTRLVLAATAPLLAFHQQMEPIDAGAAAGGLLAGEDFFDVADRYVYAEDAGGTRRREKFVTGEFVVGRPYGARVSVANLSSEQRACKVLVQIPEGAVPLSDGFYAKSLPLPLDPYAVRTFEYFFYFPAPGDFRHAAMRAVADDAVAVAAASGPLHVVAEATEVDRTAWAYVSQEGSDDEVLAYLSTHNLARVPLAPIAFRMADKAMFLRTLGLLRSRHVYDPVLWSYGFHHGDAAAMGEALRMSPLSGACGLWLDSPLLSVDANADRRYEHKEYWPLVNARAHALGDRRQILDDAFAGQYAAYLRYLGYKPRLDAKDRLALAVYLLFQDRDAEAAAMLEGVAPQDVEERMQLDYLRVYLAFDAGDAKTARALAGPWRDTPVGRWRTLFRDALAQADEAEGRAPAKDDGRAGDPAAAAPSLELAETDRGLELRYRNLADVAINLYPMDLELLFSRSPFSSDVGKRFALVRPAQRETLRLDADRDRRVVRIPDAFRGRNLLVEAEGGGVSATAVHTPNELDVRIVSSYGQATVLDAKGKPMPGVYVKVYARRHDGGVEFYKDGYTDLRGRFDYASLSTDDLVDVSRFALLFASESSGALIRETPPPAR
ncbi:MAG: hypothetical protein ACOX5G_12240 [Kiritimatiellia bacterium]|jgi:hypothetical protein